MNLLAHFPTGSCRMNHFSLAPRSRATVGCKSFTLNAIFLAGLLVISTPALASNGNTPGDPDNNGCDPSGTQPKKCTEGVPAPLAAAGIPGLLALGGGYIAVRKRRRGNNGTK